MLNSAEGWIPPDDQEETYDWDDQNGCFVESF
jgi:hypothetical protein